MKIRNGFVSNSSSSSFMVFFPKRPESVDEVFEFMWEDNPRIESIKKSYKFDEPGQKKSKVKNFRDYNSVGMTFEEFQQKSAKDVYDDIIRQRPNDYLKMVGELLGGDAWMDHDDALCFSHYNSPEDRFKERYRSIEELEEDINLNEDLTRQREEFDWGKGDESEYDNLEPDYMLEKAKESLDEIKEYARKHKGMTFYAFGYSDESGTYSSIMEHGGVFGKLPCYVESHH